jgi:hypothetical protein
MPVEKGLLAVSARQWFDGTGLDPAPKTLHNETHRVG